MLGPAKHGNYSAVRWLIFSAVVGGISVMLSSTSIPLAVPIIGVAIAAVGLALGIWKSLIEPKLRIRKLKRPCDVRFVVRGAQDVDLNYVVQDDERHILDELVLPSHSVVEIEFGYMPKVPIQLEELVFGCEGDHDSKPYVIAALDRFTGQRGQDKPAQGEHTIDIGRNWHTVRKVARPVGSHFVVTYRLQTQSAGTYPVKIAFMTNEIEGNGELTIRVEDRPTTRMRCRGHEGCWVRPMPISPSASAARSS